MVMFTDNHYLNKGNIDRKDSNDFPMDDITEGVLEKNEAHNKAEESGDVGNKPLNKCGDSKCSEKSVFGDISGFRDFFLAFFSDGYYNLACCGSEGLLPGGDFLRSNPRSKDKSPVQYAVIEKSPSTQSHTSCPLHTSASHDSGRQTPQRRKRPLALAVGWKYAEDMNGRPIVITPGNRRVPIKLNGSKIQGRSRSPPQFPGQPEMPTTPKVQRRTNPNLFMVQHKEEIHVMHQAQATC